MSRAILFDVNETLLDLSVLQPHFQRAFGDAAVMQSWFAVLLHTSVVTTVTDAYQDFGTLAGAALDVVAARQGKELSEEERKAILGTVRELPPHPDVVPNLDRLRDSGLRMVTLTNSAHATVSAQISNAGLNDYFETFLSVDDVRAFKPSPEPYRMAAASLGVEVNQTRLVAAHDWDVFGALRAGCQAAFIARGGRPYHPLYEKPDVMGPDLAAVTDQILELDT
ncbi:MAG: haloacid dehalogenase type II [Candidatus Methylomirabilales bacterium]